MIRETGGEGDHELLPGVRLKTLVHGERTILTEVRFVGGAVVPVHAHLHEQTGYLVAGSLRFTVDGEELVVRPGDSWNLPSKVPHGAVALEDSVVVEVFSPPREDYLALFDGAGGDDRQRTHRGRCLGGQGTGPSPGLLRAGEP